jgi:hypothetical protein
MVNFDFVKQFTATGSPAVKIGLCVLALLVLLFVVSTFEYGGRGGMNTFTQLGSDGSVSVESMPSTMPPYEERDSYGKELSLRNVAPSPMMPPVYNAYSAGNDAEAFEVRNYSATIETRDRTRDCDALRALKARTDVMFEQANEYDRGCSYTFKVEKKSVEAVLALITELKPKELSENTYTIKREVDDYTSEITILENKLVSLDTTLTDALASYENITELATRTGDVESLAKIIESKLMLIERLTNARIETSNQLEYIGRAKADALDRLAYTYFTVTVYENTYADGEALKDSWKFAVQEFVRKVNQFAQEMSIGLFMLMLAIFKYALYGLIMLFVLKFGWKFVQGVWKS